MTVSGTILHARNANKQRVASSRTLEFDCGDGGLLIVGREAEELLDEHAAGQVLEALGRVRQAAQPEACSGGGGLMSVQAPMRATAAWQGGIH